MPLMTLPSIAALASTTLAGTAYAQQTPNGGKRHFAAYDPAANIRPEIAVTPSHRPCSSAIGSTVEASMLCGVRV